MPGKIIRPSPEEDREITRAAESDPDNPPLTHDLEGLRRVRGPQKKAER